MKSNLPIWLSSQNPWHYQVLLCSTAGNVPAINLFTAMFTKHKEPVESAQTCSSTTFTQVYCHQKNTETQTYVTLQAKLNIPVSLSKQKQPLQLLCFESSSQCLCWTWIVENVHFIQLLDLTSWIIKSVLQSR